VNGLSMVVMRCPLGICASARAWAGDSVGAPAM